MDNRTITKQNIIKIKELLTNISNLSDKDYASMLKKMARFHDYSIYNQMILFYNDCSQVAGFKKWINLGRTIKKGSKAVWILAPNGYYTITKKVTLENGTIEEKEISINSFKSVPVFDISSTEGKELERLTKYSNIDFKELVLKVEKVGLIVAFQPLEIKLGGFIDKNRITLNSNLSTTEQTGTLLHELSHYYLNHTTAKDNTEEGIKEQEAETLTYLLCNILGIERNSVFYLKSWNTTSDILSSFKKINTAYNKLIKVIA